MLPDSVISDVSRHINARLGPIELIRVINQLESGNPAYDPHRIESILFPCANRAVFDFFLRSDYAGLIASLMESIRVEPGTMDVFLSEIDERYMKIFSASLQQQVTQVKIEPDADHARFIVTAPEFLLDFSLPAISQFHSEMDLVAANTLKWLDAVGGNTSMLFLNAKGASFLSNFSQIWIADKLGVPLDGPSTGIIGVV